MDSGVEAMGAISIRTIPGKTITTVKGITRLSSTVVQGSLISAVAIVEASVAVDTVEVAVAAGIADTRSFERRSGSSAIEVPDLDGGRNLLHGSKVPSNDHLTMSEED
jgi:hypothetical protein